jgi:lysophospholipase L1-like esterase
VTAIVFYDENGNGILDAQERVRIPNTEVLVGGRAARSAGTTGQATVENVAAGAQTASVNPLTLPPYYVPGAPVPVQVPPAAGSTALLPVTLPIGNNRANAYLLFGDSITAGEGSSGGGYGGYLQADLRNYVGQAFIINEGLAGTKSDRGNERMFAILARTRAAYTLILYGTNDWNDLDCKIAVPCFTVDSLRGMIHQARSLDSLPIIGTIPPVNPLYVGLGAVERNDWVVRMNDAIRAMARQEGVPVADIHAALLKEPSLPPLFDDYLHPNDSGYAIVSRVFFQAITNPRNTTSSSTGP